MSLTRDDVIDLLSFISAVDLRTVGDTDVKAWGATLRNDLTRELAFEAIRIHHATSTERIKPAHVNATAIRIRRETAEREDAAARERRQAGHDRRHGLAQGDPQLGYLPIDADGDPVPAVYDVGGAIDRICVCCGAQPMQPCINTYTGNPRKMPCLKRITGKGALL